MCFFLTVVLLNNSVRYMICLLLPLLACFKVFSQRYHRKFILLSSFFCEEGSWNIVFIREPCVVICRSYCWEHKPVQIFPDKESRGPSQCTICLDLVEHLPLYSVLKSPCCKNAWFHRECLQVRPVLHFFFFFYGDHISILKNMGQLLKIM